MATEVQFACALVMLLYCGCTSSPTPSISPTEAPKPCNNTPQLDNGSVTGNNYSTDFMWQYKFKCDYGYALVGEDSITCLYRTTKTFFWWTNVPPVCVPLNITTPPKPTSTSTTPTTTGTSPDAENTTYTTRRPTKPTRRPINLLRFGYTPWAIITLVVIILLVVWIVNCCMGPMF
ncbi:membrane protein E3 [Equid gammaherpesvirus 2]|nr:membrane protein E3 [Equid gammaherpesvirus 2]